MINHDEAAAVRPLTLAWVRRHLEVGERIVRTEALHGGITAEMRRLIIGTRDRGTRDLVLRSFVDPFYMERAEDWLNREAGALTLLAGTDVPAPGLVAVDPTGAHCEYPSLLMTHLAGRTVLDDEGLETRVPPPPEVNQVTSQSPERGRVYRRCGCRRPDGRQFGASWG
ncbi:hypothetical protein ABZS85_10840, partial [Streptomyces sp. NPDC005322]